MESSPKLKIHEGVLPHRLVRLFPAVKADVSPLSFHYHAPHKATHPSASGWVSIDIIRPTRTSSFRNSGPSSAGAAGAAAGAAGASVATVGAPSAGVDAGGNDIGRRTVEQGARRLGRTTERWRARETVRARMWCVGARRMRARGWGKEGDEKREQGVSAVGKITLLVCFVCDRFLFSTNAHARRPPRRCACAQSGRRCRRGRRGAGVARAGGGHDKRDTRTGRRGRRADPAQRDCGVFG